MSVSLYIDREHSRCHPVKITVICGLTPLTMPTKPTRILAFVFVLASLVQSVQAQQVFNYVPDTTFDGNGLKDFVYFNNIDRMYGCALQADQKLITAGLSKNPQTGFFELCITRFDTIGDFDLSFGTNLGTAYVPLNTQSIGGMLPKVRIDDQGRILAIGYGFKPNGNSNDMVICRLDSNGVLDPTFNGNGVVFIDMTGTDTQPDQVSALDIDASGNIWLAGATRVGGTPLDNDFAVVKIRPNGSLDPSFNGTGKKLFNPTGAAEFSRGIKVDANGKIVVGGDAGANMFVMRFDSTGALDNTFNTSGTLTVTFQLGSDMAALDFDSQGRILVSGQLSTSASNVAVARILPNGTLDPNFGFQGKYSYNIGGLGSFITAMHIQADDKILMGGYSNIAGNANDFMATRVDTAGVIDITFNTLGYVTQPVIAGAINEEANGMAVTNDGRIYLTGTIVYSSAINEDVALMRLAPVPASGVGISETNASSLLRVGPNPFRNELTIASRLTSEAALMDVQGRRVLSFSITEGINRIDSSSLPDGMYFLQVPGTASIKLIKE